VPPLDSVLADGGLPATVRHAVAQYADGAATEAQALAIPRLRESRSILFAAPTGSGKTLVAATAIARDLAGGASAPSAPRALVLCPTRELAEQVEGVLATVLEGIGARTAVFAGRPVQRRDTLVLARPVDCLVATPGRMLELLRTKRIGLGALRRIVLDEADLLLGDQFAAQTEAIVNAVPRAARESVTVLAMSATLAPETAAELELRFSAPPLLISTPSASQQVGGAPEAAQQGTPTRDGGLPRPRAYAGADDPSDAAASSGEPARSVDSAAPATSAPGTAAPGAGTPASAETGRGAAGPPKRLELVLAEGKAATARAVATVCARARSAMVFVPRREDVAGLLEHLRSEGFAAAGYTGRSAPSTRAEAMEALRSGRASVLVCTDVAGRGIDIDSLALVVHVGVPHSAAELTHRSGRTGRGHRVAGIVAAIVTPRDRDRIASMSASAGIDIRQNSSARELAEKLGTSDVRTTAAAGHAPNRRGPARPSPAEPESRRARKPGKTEGPIARGRKDEREAQRARGRRFRRGR